VNREERRERCDHLNEILEGSLNRRNGRFDDLGAIIFRHDTILKFQNKLVADRLEPRFRIPSVNSSQLDQASLESFIKSGKPAQAFLIHPSKSEI
jgi:hypothetical protein